MKKRNNKHEKRLRMLILAVVVCTFILGASTYAWFIGMRTVNVSSFDVSIATTESLMLSIDGKTWTDNLEINSENYNTAAYAGNTNSWGGEDGLIPMSSIGKIDTAASRMILFEKGSFTASDGGYRLMASQVQNGVDDAGEADGYVAFDLFIRNLSGNEYYEEVDFLNEEAIYLTPGSAVKVSGAGADKEKTGIENSVRVAFMQIGRVKSDAAEGDITGITCADGGNALGICADRDATIWEPNDTQHVQNAINWYNTACKKRTGADLTAEDAYTAEACATVANGTHYPTYAVSGVINYTDNVDNYDGTEYNGYTGSISADAATGKLVGVNTFTDSEKNLQGTARPEFIRLAPNSITKVRVYIWLEGQDVDNYDFAQLGKQISVNFGFTKERFYGEDIDYTGPELPDDVQKDMVTQAYTERNTDDGGVDFISDSYVTYADGNFSIPSWITSFSFMDGDVRVLASKSDLDQQWSFTDID